MGCQAVWVRFVELAEKILDRAGPTRIVAIDGPGGAGKSTFARRLSSVLDDAPIVHTDDFASARNPIDWWPRMMAQVIEPLSRGRPAMYQRFDWATESLADWIELEPRPVVIIEGVTSARREWRHHLGFIIWVQTPPSERLRRGLERDGPDSAEDWARWSAQEHAHYLRDPTRGQADLVVDGSAQTDGESFAILAEPP